MKRFSRALLSDRSVFFAALACLLSATVSGCAVESVKSERQGLFDRLSSGSSGRLSYHVAAVERRNTRKIAADELKKISFDWPVKRVEVTSRYGRRGDGFHEGVDLRARVGTPVYAAQAGTVIHSGSQISGYGKMIVIRHTHGWATIYAHNSKLLVRQGQYVRKGQKIAISGKTGHVTGPHVHFEVRNGLSAYDPLEILGKPSKRPPSRRRLIAGKPDSDDLKPHKGPAARLVRR